MTFTAEQHYSLSDQSYVQSEATGGYQWSLRIWPVNTSLEQELEDFFMQQEVARFYVAERTEHRLELHLDCGQRSKFESECVGWLGDKGIQYALVALKARQKKPGLMVFDMDSTLIQMECIDELARKCGFYDKVAAITDQAMRGELDFSQSLRQRVALLKGLSFDVLNQLSENLPVTPGVESVVDWAKQNDCKIAVVSGGFVPFVERLKQQLGLDYAFANSLEVKDNVLTGQVLGDIVDGEKKKSLLLQLGVQLGLAQEKIWAIGDGANDLPMMSVAGLGVAFDAKPKVKKLANAAISEPDMTHLLTLLKN